jgi:hypothetical protein
VGYVIATAYGLTFLFVPAATGAPECRGNYVIIEIARAGYLSFAVPMPVTGLLSPELRRATPSIMCGFALILAVILSVYVAPMYARESSKPA